MLTSLHSVRKAAVGAVGAGMVTGAIPERVTDSERSGHEPRRSEPTRADPAEPRAEPLKR